MDGATIWERQGSNRICIYMLFWDYMRDITSMTTDACTRTCMSAPAKPCKSQGKGSDRICIHMLFGDYMKEIIFMTTDACTSMSENAPTWRQSSHVNHRGNSIYTKLYRETVGLMSRPPAQPLNWSPCTQTAVKRDVYLSATIYYGYFQSTPWFVQQLIK